LPMEKLGFVEATKGNGLEHLRNGELVVLFPEGEYGNFKPSTKAYKLQEFKRGFVRMALETQSPIIPVVIIGAEETHINLKLLKLTKYLPGAFPLPLNLLPLPAKWKIKFLEPRDLPFKKDSSTDRELVHEISSELRERLQKEIVKELKSRSSIFL
jgi:1-acyl-sn-glycerol-3-phosphate acyltransferase